LAEGDDGPYIPSMAIEAIIRKAQTGARPKNGARPATRALDLADYEALFAQKSIYSAMRSPEPQSAPLYRKVLGAAFDALPDQVKALHDATQSREWVGQAEVRRGTGWIARQIAGMIGFPQTAAHVPVRVILSPESGGETWLRNFGGKTFSSFQTCGTGKNDALLTERFGVIRIALALVVEGERLFFVPRRWSCLGIPLPGFLLPSGQSFETERGGDFCFDVEIAVPFIGLIVAYRGTLKAVRV
jgi:hypothetical protein